MNMKNWFFLINMPLSAVAGDFKVHHSAFTVGLQTEAENTMVTIDACKQIRTVVGTAQR